MVEEIQLCAPLVLPLQEIQYGDLTLAPTMRAERQVGGLHRVILVWAATQQ